MASEWGKQEAHKLLILGLVFAERYDNERALDLFTEALSHNPSLVAAHMAVGLTYGQLEAYAEMLSAFREAINLSPLTLRIAIVQRPKEVALIHRILNPPDPSPPNEAFITTMPSEFEKAGNLVRAGMDYIAEARDEEAIEALEQSLRLDQQSHFAISLLALAYLLLWGRSMSNNSTDNADSVLCEIAPDIAKLLFRNRG
jgi:tetratricopeptide (TPR) repeat protein